MLENEIDFHVIFPDLQPHLHAIRNLISKFRAELRQCRQTIASLRRRVTKQNHEIISLRARVAERDIEVASLRSDDDPVEFAISSWTDARRRHRG
jgi:septal ring factor EnvC (AmiA/AmiB activator)